MVNKYNNYKNKLQEIEDIMRSSSTSLNIKDIANITHLSHSVTSEKISSMERLGLIKTKKIGREKIIFPIKEKNIMLDFDDIDCLILAIQQFQENPNNGSNFIEEKRILKKTHLKLLKQIKKVI